MLERSPRKLVSVAVMMRTYRDAHYNCRSMLEIVEIIIAIHGGNARAVEVKATRKFSSDKRLSWIGPLVEQQCIFCTYTN